MSWLTNMLNEVKSTEKLLGYESRNLHYCLLIAFVSSALLIRWLLKPKLNLPKGPVGLPFVGYLPFLGKEPYKTFHNLREKYGNIFRVQLGFTNVIILADYPAVEEVFGKIEAAGRPPELFGFLPDRLGFADANGEEWLHRRRFAVRTMRDLGLGKNTWISLIQEEMSDFLSRISRHNGQPIEISSFLSQTITNNIVSMLFGKRLPPGPYMDTIIESGDTVSSFFAQSGLWLYFPWLCKILAEVKGTSFYETLRKLKRFNRFFRDESDLHKKTPSSGKGDFIAAYLQGMEQNSNTEKKGIFTESNMIGDAQVMFIGGSDTIRASLKWLFLCMVAFPDVQDKVYAEVQSVLGKEQMTSWEDRVKLPYTYAVILEGQRFKTTVPLNTTRRATENFKAFAYDIPKDSYIIANNWGLHNDPRYWSEPEKFKPERFLKEDGKVDPKPKSFVAFSYGRRKCPGELIALMAIFLHFTTVVRRFHIKAPEGRKINLEGNLGILFVPLPQELCFMPRH